MSIEFLIVMCMTMLVEFVTFVEIYVQNIEVINILSMVIPILFLGAIIYEIAFIKKVYGIDKKHIIVNLITILYLIVYAAILIFTRILPYAT